ncbi:MAG: hypothetical protein K2J11_11530 [Oscillospiraceae bacterium]|nr:hypothetical protein [Oscillospiraceae bacterium]
MVFDYKREVETVIAYGKEYPVPTMTISTYNKINEIVNRINGSLNDVKENTQARLDGIAFFIGEDEKNRIFPSIDDVDVNEVVAFWGALKNACDDNTTAVIKKYTPNVTIRKPND